MIVLKMVKYTIISLILVDFVAIFYMFCLFEQILGGQSALKMSKFWGVGVNQFQEIPKGEGGISTLEQVQSPKVLSLFNLEMASLSTRLHIYNLMSSVFSRRWNVYYTFHLRLNTHCGTSFWIIIFQNSVFELLRAILN